MKVYVIDELFSENSQKEFKASFQNESDVIEYLNKQSKEKSFLIHVEDIKEL